MPTSIALCATSTLVTDQRLLKVSESLGGAGHKVVLIGRAAASQPLQPNDVKVIRLRCWFAKGKLFYLEFNLRLFLFLLRSPFRVVCANDLDTLPAAYMASRLRRKALVFDAHEFFTEMEEVVHRPATRWLWMKVEQWLVPRCQAHYTVSEGYARLYAERLQIAFEVVRNVPVFRPVQTSQSAPAKTPVVIYQGALNPGRGIEESIEAVLSLTDVEIHLYGDGPLRAQLQLSYQHPRVRFFGAVHPERLRAATASASVGLCLFSDVGLHHQHSLANRFFDYMHAGIPQVASGFPEYTMFNATHEVALLVNPLSAANVASAISALLADQNLYDRLATNARRAAEIHHWQADEKRLLAIYAAVS